MTVKEAIFKSLEELEGVVNYMQVYQHIIDNDYYKFKESEFSPRHVSSQFRQIIRGKDPRIKEIRIGRKCFYYLTKNESTIDLEKFLRENGSDATMNKIVNNKTIIQKRHIKFSKIHQEDILWAIQQIEKEGVPPNLHSSTYDVVYQDKRYPPKLVFSLAYKHATGHTVSHDLFEGGLNTECFKAIEDNNFIIEPKTIFQTVQTFLSQATTGSLKTKNYAKKYKGLDITVSFGQGTPAHIPWISFLYEGQTTSKGIYPVYLYYKKENILILSYSVSETNLPAIRWQFKEKRETVGEYFARQGYEKPVRYGNCYVFKVYDVNNLSEEEVNRDIDQIIDEYKEQMEQSAATKKGTGMREQVPFRIERLIGDMGQTGLRYSDDLLARFSISLLTKPFVILSGLAGSGKTRLALSFVKWISEEEKQYKVVPVGADWTNREPLLGYPDALDKEGYICPENHVLELIDRAGRNPGKPYFLILDEMNLSHVERYFADFLSAMESGEPILLHEGGQRGAASLPHIDKEIRLPRNFFIIGTINVDETTYMFSPKVLDRAQVIEFRVSEEEMESFFQQEAAADGQQTGLPLDAEGACMAADFIELADRTVKLQPAEPVPGEVWLRFFHALKKVGAEFGYRTASEMVRFSALAQKLYPTWEEKDMVDHIVIQKLLPKLHGSRKKIVPILEELWKLCLPEKSTVPLEMKEPEQPFAAFCTYPVTAEKVWRMYKSACDNGYTSFAEA